MKPVFVSNNSLINATKQLSTHECYYLFQPHYKHYSAKNKSAIGQFGAITAFG